ncbi:MAG: hypothetical protein R2867_02740 [Caldilineaceae bacterium]
MEIDQSGHIEMTRDNTALALANGKRYCILVPPRTARNCLLALRHKQIRPPKLQVRLFSATLACLLEEQINERIFVTIDREYAGLDQDIQRQLLRLLHRQGIPIRHEQITFGHVGKKSPAHDLALAAYRGEVKPDRIITTIELLEKLQA